MNRRQLLTMALLNPIVMPLVKMGLVRKVPTQWTYAIIARDKDFIDSFAIWDRALTNQEIEVLKNYGAAVYTFDADKVEHVKGELNVVR